ncbi:hypothetical protein CLIB1444_02S08064 [[Candida] jaroonii]|uniref:Uncharacterized protein n=1 Tax=[Candida] jaroonii TaxID=467808 RepID=A0ACA9Y4U8_9ASCO|nr:hypothetical protein CLIB1444_02S08064 [[Candida] jaroonii]
MDLDKVLSSTESAALRDKEIERILACHNKDFFAILDIPRDLEGVKKTYRKKSLLIHPDKSDHKQASIAFDKLKRAYDIAILEEESSEDPEIQRKIDEKKKLIDIYKYVGEKPVDTTRKEVYDILIKEDEEEEKEKQIQKHKEAQEQDHMESLKQQRQLKKEFDEKWEDQRESRVENWRNFVKKVEKKKKPKKKKVLA